MEYKAQIHNDGTISVTKHDSSIKITVANTEEIPITEEVALEAIEKLKDSKDITIDKTGAIQNINSNL